METTKNELEKIAERGMCGKCGKPNLLWQPRRNLFRCGWCGTDYWVTEAMNLLRISDKEYNLVMSKRRDIIAKASK